MNLKISLPLAIVLLVSFTLVACGGNNSVSAPLATDYSQAKHWLSIPVVTEAVDVFYLYPTAWQRGANDPYICPIDNPSMLAGSASVFTRTATAFEPFANIYAPYYRH
jgi:hypothetical protein